MYLFDENKQCVMLVFWRDAWYASQKGYFKTCFYTQNGSCYYQQSDYIHTSFLRTGKLWWADGGAQSPQGVIYSTIDGRGGAAPIARCDNASRVIKYVVIQGCRYGAYNLVEMRIHDINVVVDLNRHDPNAPDSDNPVEQEGV